MTSLLITAALLGLAGSLHCVGMCGPLVLALPNQSSLHKQCLNNILYQLGRILTYALLGALVGSFGKSLSFIGFQQPLSLSVGICLLIFLFLPNQLKTKLEISISHLFFTRQIKKMWAYFFKMQNSLAFFMVGIMNGALPCGLVYAALAGAMAGESALHGALFMVSFGFGTTPLLLATVSAKSLFTKKLRPYREYLLPFSLSTMAILLILRGASLDIPYLSPIIQANEAPNCCQNK